MDKRKNNGGHSTKAKGVDKRKNQFRNALEDAATVEDVKDVLKKVLSKAKEGNLKAAELFLAYYIGKPTQIIEQTTTHNLNDFDIRRLYDPKT